MIKKSILFICPYPFDEAPSQRFRFEQYLPILKEEEYHFRLAPFLNQKAWRILYKPGNSFKKAYLTLISFLKRVVLLFKVPQYEYVFLHREATPIGPPFVEWFISKVFKKKIIYDFDDAIWLEDPNEEGSFKAWLKWKSKVKHICTWSHKVSCGNDYLAKFAKNYNADVVINPTTIDTQYHQELAKRNTKKAVIGWTGTHSTLPYLKHLLPVLKQISAEYDFELLIISNQPPNFEVPNMRYLPWRKKTEIEDLNNIDIGIMPLTDDIWSKGKCGFKILQYMAISKPVIASPIGVNKKLINESLAGFLAKDDKEWKAFLLKLLKESSLRADLGNKGRDYVKAHFSVKSNKNTFLNLIH